MKGIFYYFGVACLLSGAMNLTMSAAERIPPAPARYFNDYAKVVSPGVVEELNARLEQFERTNSSQLLVAIFPQMDSDSSVEDYTVRVAQAWRVGQKEKSNGAVLFAFMKEHQVYLQVGYGLEAVLPDAMAKRIIESEIVPRFRQGDVDGGMRAAVGTMMAAAKGEYRGTGRTQDEGTRPSSSSGFGFMAFFALIAVVSAIARRRSRRNYVFGGPRAGWWLGGPRGGIGGGGWTSGSGGGGGFSGGGGSFGGGGAGGKW